MMFILATNGFASRLAKPLPTGTLTGRAKKIVIGGDIALTQDAMTRVNQL